MYSKPVDGFSLLEIMIAVFILATGLLSVARLLAITMDLDASAYAKGAAATAAQNEIDRLYGLYRQNPAAEELTVGTHQSAELIEIKDPLNQKTPGSYKITWSVGNIPDPRPDVSLSGRILSVRATPALTENMNNTDPFPKNSITFNVVVAAEP